MARTLNNEVDVLNIASLDNDIKDSFTRAMITEDVNTTSAAARRYLKGEYFIHTDRYLYKALEDIAAGTTITPDANVEVVTVSEELVRLFAQSPEGIFEILSNIENTSVASKNYVKGSQFIWTDKNLYEATSDIASGSTFVIGTNIKLADNLTSQIQTLMNSDDAMLNILGAKNLLPNNATSQTISGVTFTKNPDGSITAKGTPEATISYSIDETFVGEVGKKYTLTGCPSGGSNTTYCLASYLYGNTYDARDIGAGANFTVVGGKIHTRIIIYTAAGDINLTFKPMIRPASIADDTYVPHAMTNRELTTIETLVDASGIEVKRYGRIVEIIGRGGLHVNQDVILPSNSPYRPLANVVTAGFSTAEVARVGIRADGTLIFTIANGTPITTATACFFQLSYTI